MNIQEVKIGESYIFVPPYNSQSKIGECVIVNDNEVTISFPAIEGFGGPHTQTFNKLEAQRYLSPA